MGFLRRKWIWTAIGLPILIVAWLNFRPEKLWINHRVVIYCERFNAVFGVAREESL